MRDRIPSVVIEGVTPQVENGRFAVKRAVGEVLCVEADVFKEGHEVLAAVVRWRQVTPRPGPWAELPMRALQNDRWGAELALSHNGRLEVTVEAWPDAYRTWLLELERKLAVGRSVRSELLEGAGLLKEAGERAAQTHPKDASTLSDASRALGGDLEGALRAAADPVVTEAASRHADRSAASRYDRLIPVVVDRRRAQVGSWYEFFPRSSAARAARHGSFKDAEAFLPYVERLGFDVVYLPPIHPIGVTGRKGRNNGLVASPGDVGSPWAIGGPDGGHKAIHPALGTLEDFRRFVGRAAEHGLEVALDLAFQCSPDHPYVREHPEWFQRRPDGTLKTAENPPKRYEDIVNFDWTGPARESLWAELKSVVLFWVQQGIRLFRVDNPHTKPIPFWQWLIREVQDADPGVVFLAEAFTRPKLMKALAKVGFSQSYTYFTWRNFKRELADYMTELTQGPMAEYFRGNLWPNTPDILPEVLQRGGPPAFKARLALAATLSSSYGIYSGYELCESRALPNSEEYQDSEKYQIVTWDWDRPENIRAFVAAINRIRRENPALQEYRNLRFHPSDSDFVLFYGKATADGSNQVLVAINLDPFEPQTATLTVPVEALGVAGAEAYEVDDLLTGDRLLWRGASARVTLTPQAPAAIWRVRRFNRNERAFDYY